jgi:hypothetical protein
MLGFKLPLHLLAIVNQCEARAPATTKVCLESKGDDAGLVGLVDPCELFGHLGPGDRRSRRVNDIDDELAAGEEAVRGEFSGTYRDGGQVILADKKKRKISGERCVCFARSLEKHGRGSIIQTREVPSSTFERAFRP